MTLLGRRTQAGAVPLQRAQEVGPSDLLIVAVDRDGAARWAGTTPDPGIVRAEFPDASGLLSGQVVERTSVEALVVVPAHPELTGARVYRPRPDGKGLALLGSVPLA